MATYLSRVVDAELSEALNIAGAVLIEGARGCGKTETGREHSRSEALLDTDQSARALAELAPSALLDGATPRLLDEWQLAPALWDHVRRAVDDRRKPGQFILTGSSVPPDEALRHSGAGRILRIRMRPLSLFEAGASSGQVSLGELLAGEKLEPRAAENAVSVQDVAALLAKGGWPNMQPLEPAEAQRLLRSYLDDVARIDVPRLQGQERRDTNLIRRTLTSLARHVATEATVTAIASDVGGSAEPPRTETVSEYLALLERVFVVEMQPSWSPHLRSKARVRKRAKLHFVDPALAVAGLGASAEALMRDLNTFGLLFESLVIRDLRVYAQRSDAIVSHFRDSSNLEVDAIVEAVNGRWLAVEVKLGESQTDAAAASLLRFRETVDTTKTAAPAALVVVTMAGYAYTRPDGVHVVPLAMLGP